MKQKKTINEIKIPNFKEYKKIELNEIDIPDFKSYSNEKLFKQYEIEKTGISVVAKEFKRGSISFSKIFNLGISKARSNTTKHFDMQDTRKIILAKKKFIVIHEHGNDYIYYSTIELMNVIENKLYITFKKARSFNSITPVYKIIFPIYEEMIEFMNIIFTLMEKFPTEKKSEQQNSIINTFTNNVEKQNV